MTNGPYKYVQDVLIPDPNYPGNRQPLGYTAEIHMADSPIVSLRKEEITIRTTVCPPFPRHEKAVLLKALLHVRDALTEQIEEMMRSP
jgi:hypothetical protein